MLPHRSSAQHGNSSSTLTGRIGFEHKGGIGRDEAGSGSWTFGTGCRAGKAVSEGVVVPMMFCQIPTGALHERTGRASRALHQGSGSRDCCSSAGSLFQLANDGPTSRRLRALLRDWTGVAATRQGLLQIARGGLPGRSHAGPSAREEHLNPGLPRDRNQLQGRLRQGELSQSNYGWERSHGS